MKNNSSLSWSLSPCSRARYIFALLFVFAFSVLFVAVRSETIAFIGAESQNSDGTQGLSKPMKGSLQIFPPTPKQLPWTALRSNHRPAAEENQTSALLLEAQLQTALVRISALEQSLIQCQSEREGAEKREGAGESVAPSDGDPPARAARASPRTEAGDGAEEVKPLNQEHKLNTRSLLLSGGDQEKVKSLLYRFDQPANLTHEMLTVWGGHGYDADHPGEEGWVFNLNRNVSSSGPSRRNDHYSFYEPSRDVLPLSSDAQFHFDKHVREAYSNGQFPRNAAEKREGFRREWLNNRARYSRSPVPKNSWSVVLPGGKGKVITMDEIAFAYDIWFEENRIFNQMSWMGVLSQQDPMDGYAIADMLWRVKPDLIIEIGTNTGGGAIFYSTFMRAYNPNGKIVTIDVRNVSNWSEEGLSACAGCTAATEHPWWHDGMIQFRVGDVTDADFRKTVEDEFVSKAKIVLVIEDASHHYVSTINNLNAIYSWVTKGSYLLVQDTKMDRFSYQANMYKGSYFGPMFAVDTFLKRHGDLFTIDRRFEYFLYSQHHRGWLRRK